MKSIRQGAIRARGLRRATAGLWCLTWKIHRHDGPLRVVLGAGGTSFDGWISTEELRLYVSSLVSKRSERHQNPTVDRANLHARIVLPVVD